MSEPTEDLSKFIKVDRSIQANVDPAPRNPFRSTTGPAKEVHTARHRVDPMRPANPHTADPELEDLYQDFHRERVGRTGPNLTVGLILLALAVFVATVLFVVAWGLWLS